jgi:CheY-like chemotaxis protein
MPDTKAKVLVVDDEPLVRTTMSLVLGEIGYRVRSADNGFSALREIRQEIPDILLTDLNMPACPASSCSPWSIAGFPRSIRLQ